MNDEIESKIVLELRRDGRISATQIAQRLGVSVPTVTKRLNYLFKNDLISIKAFPNPEKLGYQFGALICLKVDLKSFDLIYTDLIQRSNRIEHESGSLIGINVNLNSFNHIYADFSENPEIYNINGFKSFDIIIIAHFLECNMLLKFIKDELTTINGINNLETYLISEVIKRNQEILNKKLLPYTFSDFDEIDRKLIQELMINGRPNYSDLSKKLGTSKSTVSRKVAFLIKENLVKILAIPNPAKVDYSFNAYVVLRTKIDDVDKICEQLSQFPEICLLVRLLNGYNILFCISSVSIKELQDFLKNHIVNLSGVISSQSCMCYLLYK